MTGKIIQDLESFIDAGNCMDPDKARLGVNLLAEAFEMSSIPDALDELKQKHDELKQKQNDLAATVAELEDAVANSLQHPSVVPDDDHYFKIELEKLVQARELDPQR